MPADLRDKWDKEAQRLKHTVEGGAAGSTAMKAARTRFENAHRAYWTAVERAWGEIRLNPDTPPAEIAEQFGVELRDIAEVAR